MILSVYILMVSMYIQLYTSHTKCVIIVILFILVVPPPVDSVSVTNTSVSDTEVEVVVTWEPVEYVSVHYKAIKDEYKKIIKLMIKFLIFM